MTAQIRMVIAVLQFELLIHDCLSLKDKRRVILSVKDRLHREHMVSVAEVSHQDHLGVARMGLAFVTSDGKHAGQTLDRILAKLRALPDAELGDTTRQVLVPDGMASIESQSDESAASLAEEMLIRAQEEEQSPG